MTRPRPRCSTARSTASTAASTRWVRSTTRSRSPSTTSTNQIKNTKAFVKPPSKPRWPTATPNCETTPSSPTSPTAAALATNPLFSSNASKVGATNVYNQFAEGNVSTTLAGLKTYRIELTQERSVLASEDNRAAYAAHVAAKSFHEAKLLQASLKRTLGQVKGQIANFIAAEEAAAAAKNAGDLRDAHPGDGGYPAPPPDSRANIAIDAAESYLGVPYVWGGASRHGVDCSGLIMLAYEAAGIDFPHYSGAQYEDTERVPLWDIQPGDLLFYGYDGDQHVAMYVGHGEMIEAPETGEVVHITPVRLGYGFAGLGRPRA
jgi:cell wall-associated NlpC family hydrolase